MICRALLAMAARIVLVLAILAPVVAHDPNNPFLLKHWFETLKSAKGEICCGNADGIADPEWRSARNGYQVFIEGRWIDVPDSAIVKEPNQFQRTMVWIMRSNEKIVVRCFLVGTLG